MIEVKQILHEIENRIRYVEALIASKKNHPVFNALDYKIELYEYKDLHKWIMERIK